MNREGIVDNASAIGVGLIRWEEIERMYGQSSKALTWLCIVPRNVETFISRQSPFKGLLLRLSEVLFGAPIRIPDRSLPTILVAKTLERISEYLEASSSEFPPHTSKGGVRGTEELIFSERRIGAEEDAREVSGLRKYSARIGAYGATWGICFYGLLFIAAWVSFLSGGGRASTWFIYPGMFVAFSILGLAGAGLAGSGSRRIRAGAWLMLGGAAGAVASVVANDIFGFWPLLELETLLEDPTNLFGPYAVALLGAAAFAPVPMLLIAAVPAFVTHGRAKG